MLRSIKDLEGYAIGATDGSIGTVVDFYFDDEAWAIRYLVIDTGSWLSSRKVLISPIAIGEANRAARLLPVSLTMEQVKGSPDFDTEKPVTRQHEVDYLGYYGYPYYWGGVGLWGSGAYPDMMLPGDAGDGSTSTEQANEKRASALPEARRRDDDPHLRSCNEVIGYHIEATDGDVGHVQGMLVDEKTWALRYLIVNTSNWWLGHDVLVAPQWIHGVSWSERKVVVDLTRESVKAAPPYDPSAALSRESESDLYNHYGHKRYWSEHYSVLETEI